MGIREADLDGIEHYYDPNVGKNGSWGTEVFVVPCHYCGRKVIHTCYGRNIKFICDACKVAKMEKRKVEQKKRDAFVDQLYDAITTKEERQFDKAVDIVRKQAKRFSSYEKDIEIARRGQFKYGSIPEAMTAIELIHLGYSIIPQQKVGKYRVDFYLPKEKIVVEVDGSLYHRDKFNGDREATIQFSLGLDAKIIHIPAEAVRKNVHIVDKVMKKLTQMP